MTKKMICAGCEIAFTPGKLKLISCDDDGVQNCPQCGDELCHSNGSSMEKTFKNYKGVIEND